MSNPPSRHIFSSDRLLPYDPNRPPETAMIRPAGFGFHQLQNENAELKRQLRDLRRTFLKAKLELEDERRLNARLERRMFSRTAEFARWIDQASLPMIYLDREGFIVEANQKQLDLAGRNRSDYLGRKFASFLQNPAEISRILKPFAEEESIRTIPANLIHSETAAKQFLLICTPCDEGWLDGICCSMIETGNLIPENEKEIQSEKKLNNFFRQRKALTDFGLRLLAEPSDEVIFRNAIAILVDILEIGAGENLELDRKQKQFRFREGTGWHAAETETLSVPDGENFHAGFAGATEKPIAIENLREEKRFQLSETLKNGSLTSGLLIRIPGPVHPFGILGIYSLKLRRFLEEEILFLGAISSLLAAAVAQQLTEKRKWTLNQRLTDVLQNLPAVVWEARLDPKTGRFIPEYISEAASRLAPGFNREKWLQSKNLFQGIHPDDSANVQKALMTAFEGKDPGSTEFRWISTKGEIYWLESYKRPARDKTGKIFGVRGILINITDRKKEELKRQAAEERFGDILANVPGAVWEMHLDPKSDRLQMTFVSDYIEQISGGFTKEEFLSNPELWLERIHPDEQEMIRKRFRELLHNRFFGSGIARWIRKDGRTIWIETSQRIIFDPSGKAIGLRGVTVDVTARRRAETERNQALQRFHAFMDNSPFGAVIKDPQGRYIYGNRLFTEWCKSNNIEWRGRSAHEIYSDPMVEQWIIEEEKVRETDQPSHSLEVMEIDGKQRYFVVTRFPSPESEEGKNVGLLIADVTERREMERNILELTDREQQRLGQELHDGLCQHLLGLALMANTVAGKLEKENLPQAADVKQLRDFSYEALELARGLMKGFNLIKAEGPCALQHALSDFLTTTSRLFSRNLQLESEVEFEILDRDIGSHLFRIAQEATHNAIKHADPSLVVVRLTRVEDALLMTIENDGLPLPDEERRRAGVGMQTMQYRSDLIGAIFSIDPRPEGGTIVSCKLQADRGIRFLDG